MRVEEHEVVHRRGEILKFLVLVIVLLGTVLLVAAIRPLIFNGIVPAVMGWNQPDTPPGGSPLVVEEATPVPFEPTPAPIEPTPLTDEAEPALTPEEQATATPTESPSPIPALQEYTVQRGDSLTVIAARFGVPIAEIVRVNNISNPNRILPGETLLIPAAP